MPYIKPERRDFAMECGADAENCGELNYHLTLDIISYLREHGEKYQTYNDIMGVLSCIQMELYRRMIAPYEDKKIKENGDVY